MSATDYMRNIFTFSRLNPFPTLYAENKTPVTLDVLEMGWIVAFITLYIAFVILLPTVVRKEQLTFFIRVSITAFIGLVIILCNFGQEWEVGELYSPMFYKAGSNEEINATVGIKLGLRSVNITLYAKPESLHGALEGEKINYNERFYWTWVQGRAGFGPFAGQVQRDFRDAQNKGLPYPVLWVAEYFTFDGEGLRFGRHYRHAGWYAHISIWCASVAWLLAIILFKIYIPYGAGMLSLLGCCLVISALIWCFYRNLFELTVIFNNNDVTGVLRTHYGVHWYLALLVGLFCIVSGVVIFIMDIFFHDHFCKFFGLNPFAIVDEDYLVACPSWVTLPETEVPDGTAHWFLGTRKPPGHVKAATFRGLETEEGDTTLDTTGDMEMQSQSRFKRENKKTVVYKARGTRKYWRQSEQRTSVWENEDYFNPENNPTKDTQYLDTSYSQLQYPVEGGQYPYTYVPQYLQHPTVPEEELDHGYPPEQAGGLNYQTVYPYTAEGDQAAHGGQLVQDFHHQELLDQALEPHQYNQAYDGQYYTEEDALPPLRPPKNF